MASEMTGPDINFDELTIEYELVGLLDVIPETFKIPRFWANFKALCPAYLITRLLTNKRTADA
jgi:hypothetical protein